MIVATCLELTGRGNTRFMDIMVLASFVELEAVVQNETNDIHMVYKYNFLGILKCFDQ